MNIGDQFRDEVACILRIAYPNLTTEKPLNSKKADIYFEQTGPFGSKMKIAVECKFLNKGITSSDIKNIYTEYLQCFELREIDKLLIVCNRNIEGEPQRTVEGFNGRVLFETNISIQNQIMDFTDYCNNIISEYEKSDLYNNFVELHSDDEIPIVAAIEAWSESKSLNQIAIVGGYGVGKTSAARTAQYRIARKYILKEHDRIPIFIPLGAFVHQQNIDGLIGYTLDKISNIPNYSWSRFVQFNDSGRFIIFLDGFDEMKHSMTTFDFEFTFNELIKLATKNSKIVILGRPTSMLTIEEEKRILHGIDSDLLEERKNGINFEIHRIRPMSKLEYMDFCRGYLMSYYKDMGHAKENIENLVLKKIVDINNVAISDLLSRPVQAKMLTKIITETDINIANITRYKLYKAFIGRFEKREYKKSSRQRVSPEERRRFIRDLAWWVWTEKKGENNFSISEIPNHIFTNKFENEFSTAQRKEEVSIDDSYKRVLIVGSILDSMTSIGLINESSGKRFYFPHRSYIEYLVSEYIVDTNPKSSDAYFAIMNMNTEVSNFIFENNSAILNNLIKETRDFYQLFNLRTIEPFLIAPIFYNIFEQIDKSYQILIPLILAARIEKSPNNAEMPKYIKSISSGIASSDINVVRRYIILAIKCYAITQGPIFLMQILIGCLQSLSEEEIIRTINEGIKSNNVNIVGKKLIASNILINMTNETLLHIAPEKVSDAIYIEFGYVFDFCERLEKTGIVISKEIILNIGFKVGEIVTEIKDRKRKELMRRLLENMRIGFVDVT